MNKMSSHRFSTLVIIGMSLLFLGIAYADNDHHGHHTGSQPNDGNCSNTASKSCNVGTAPVKVVIPEFDNGCRYYSSNEGQRILIPAKTREEWLRFKAWAEQNTQKVNTDNCEDANWGGWSSCAAACGASSQTRTCNYPPNWSRYAGTSNCTGSNTQACDDFSLCACGALAANASFCAGQNSNFSALPPSVTYVNPGSCDSVTKCQATCDSGYHFNGTSCVTDTCYLAPWGNITDGASIVAYQSSSVTYPASCASETRRCTSGSLTGSYTHASCDGVCSPLSVTNGTVASYASGCGITCNAGYHLTGTSCDPDACNVATWGSIASGSSVTAYQAASVTYPANCVSETRTCTAGNLSGSYTNAACDGVCSPSSVANGTVASYASGCGISCNSGYHLDGSSCIQDTCVPNCSAGICGANDGCGGTCQTGSCSGGNTCWAGTCSCAVPDALRFCGGMGGGIPGGGQVFDPDLCQCVCPSGTTWDGTVCQAPVPTCVASELPATQSFVCRLYTTPAPTGFQAQCESNGGIYKMERNHTGCWDTRDFRSPVVYSCSCPSASLLWNYKGSVTGSYSGACPADLTAPCTNQGEACYIFRGTAGPSGATFDKYQCGE